MLYFCSIKKRKYIHPWTKPGSSAGIMSNVYLHRHTHTGIVYSLKWHTHASLHGSHTHTHTHNDGLVCVFPVSHVSSDNYVLSDMRKWPRVSCCLVPLWIMLMITHTHTHTSFSLHTVTHCGTETFHPTSFSGKCQFAMFNASLSDKQRSQNKQR